MILNDDRETERLHDAVTRMAGRLVIGDDDTESQRFAMYVTNGMRQALAILDTNGRIGADMMDQCNADSIAASMAEAAWFAMLMVIRVTNTPQHAMAEMIDARRRIYSWAIGFKPGIGGTWQCQGCLRSFIEPGVNHNPCMP